MPVQHSRRAREDLLEIWTRVAAESPNAADRIFDRLEASIRTLEDSPEAGLTRPDIAADARMLVVRPHLVLHRIVRGGVQVVRVVHGARQIDETLFVDALE
jgi:toxin ParE1/3/4